MANEGDAIYRIHKVDDKRAIKLIKDIAAIFDGDPSEITFRLTNGMNLSFKDIPEGEFKSGEYAIWQIQWERQLSGGQRIQVYLFRRLQSMGENSADPDFDEVKLSYNDINSWRKSASKMLDVQRILKNHIAPVKKSVKGDNSSLIKELIIQNNGTHRDMMEQLSAAVSDMIKKREDLERDATAAEEERKEAHRQALEALDREREELQRQSHMSERRRIASAIGNRLLTAKTNSLKPKGVQVTGWAVFFASVLVGAAALAGLYWALSAYQMRADVVSQIEDIVLSNAADPGVIISSIEALVGPTNWYLILRSILASIIAISAFTYAAAWMKKYYDEDVQQIREIERFNDDIQRASWIVEAVHEVKHEQKGELPSEWVEAVTRNLFDHGRSERPDENALALRALMGMAAKTKIGQNGIEVELGRRGARRLGNANLSDDE